MAQPDSTRSPAVATALCIACFLPLLATCDNGSGGPRGALVINELMSDNDSAWIDEAGQVEDWIELTNTGAAALSLGGYSLRDGRGRSFELPAQDLAGGASVVVFADDDVEQGALHAPFKLSADGVTLELLHGEAVIDHVEAPALELNQAYARFPSGDGPFTTCRYASPERDNGASCEPPRAPEPSDRSWPAYAWPKDWLHSTGALVLRELALQPAQFIELRNLSREPVDLRRYQLRIAHTAPGKPWPAADEGELLAWNEDTLAPGSRVRVPVSDDDLGELAGDPLFEGVVTLFDADGDAAERVDFMRWPDGASLARQDDALQRFMFCEAPRAQTDDEPCQPLASRDVGDRVRHLYTPGDYAALAAGDTNLAMRGVKFVIDTQAGFAVHLLSTRAFALHYTFIREQIDGEAPLDRCDPAQSQQFMRGWIDFSEREYFRSQGRRYLLGALDTYSGSGLRALDFAVGDQITAAQMGQAFFGVLPHLDAEDTTAWAIHPSEPRQETELATIAGQLPIASANAPFRGVRYQPLTLGTAYGQLRFLPASELERAALAPDTIVVTDAVPNDIPFVAGLITEAFQTPLAHVNVLSQNRGTPNMALVDAQHDRRIAPLLGKLVRFDVDAAGFQLTEAGADEAAAFQAARRPRGERVAPRLDTSVRGAVDLEGRGLEDLPSIGAKAAQLAELGRVSSSYEGCPGPLALPATPFAIPVVHYLEHFEKSGARAMLAAAQADAAFRADPEQRAAVLAQLRAAITSTPIDPELQAQLHELIEQRFGETRLRFRSSSNTEDLPGFNGAGLYESWSGALGDPERPIEDAIRAVWASLWNARAYDEREYGNIDQSQVAMAVLVHPAFLSERANVIAISRDVLDPTRSDIFYINAQAGEASVANPAPGVSSEELLHHVRVIPGTPEIEYQSQSSLTHGARVLSLGDAQRISCRMNAIHDHFRALLDPQATQRWFAMDVELKLVGDAREVVVKQARPYSFGRVEVPKDCREF
jgi:hypothetical protein